MFDRILVAIGGPEHSLEPARVAGSLAAKLGSRLTIVSVYRHTLAAMGDPYYGEMLIPRLQEANDTLEQAAAVARAEGAGEPELNALEGEPAERIASLARNERFQLVIMGTHRRGRIGAALLGSVSGAVAARADVPVLVVPDLQPVSKMPLSVAGRSRAG